MSEKRSPGSPMKQSDAVRSQPQGRAAARKKRRRGSLLRNAKKHLMKLRKRLRQVFVQTDYSKERRPIVPADGKKTVRRTDAQAVGKTAGRRRRTMPAVPERPAARKIDVTKGIMILCAAVFLISAVQLGRYAVRSVRTVLLNRKLSRIHEITAEQEAPERETGDTVIAFTADEAAPEAPEGEGEAQPVQAVSEPGGEGSAGSTAGSSTGDERKKPLHQLTGPQITRMKELAAINPDLVAWLSISDLIDLPVVYRNNTYYLDHDFNKQKSASGAIFLDERFPLLGDSEVLILHGHNMKDGTMFGRLVHYKSSLSVLKNHPLIHFETLWEDEVYVIFAVLDAPVDTADPEYVNYYRYTSFSGKDDFERYVSNLMAHSLYAIPVDAVYGDALLLLSTCNGDDRRVVVAARRVRDGEDRAALKTYVRLSTVQ